MAVEDNVRARAFISCGQSKGTDEVQIAEAIAAKLKILGFEPYIAVVEQTLVGLTENIYNRLRNSEYFLFIDFKREPLAGTEPPQHRGSLFSHQELAIASFHGLDVLAFQESGVKPDDGIIRFLQANSIQFNDRHALAELVDMQVRGRIADGRWDPSWRSELLLERRPPLFVPSFVPLQQGGHRRARFFHITVRNRHRSRLATNCCAFLEKATGPRGTEIPLETVEFKWAGSTIPSVGIAPQSTRRFDAFFLWEDSPTVLQFPVWSDSTEFIPQIAGAGEHKLTYVVRADNFPPARKEFTLDLKTNRDETTFG
jgi:hypothetical protein